MTFSLYLLTLLSLVSFERVLSDDTTCSDAYQCDGETIDSTNVYCYGYYACEDADIEATAGYMYGAFAAYNATVESKYTYGYGLAGLAYSDLSTYTASVLGYLNCYAADIDAYTTTLVLKLYGYFAGYYADVLCYSGDTCYVYCGKVYGCYDLDYYCYSGATCYYDCDDDSDYCPTLYSGVSSEVSAITALGNNLKEHNIGLTDDEISELYHQSREEVNKRLVAERAGKQVEIDFGKFPNSARLQRDFERAMMQPTTSKNGKATGLVESVLKHNLTSFAGGMLCMVLVGKLYMVYRNKRKNDAYLPVGTME